jgi:hypothetical protein
MARPVSQRSQNVFSPRKTGAPDWSMRDRLRLMFYRWLYRTGRLNDG